MSNVAEWRKRFEELEKRRASQRSDDGRRPQPSPGRASTSNLDMYNSRRKSQGPASRSTDFGGRRTTGSRFGGPRPLTAETSRPDTMPQRGDSLWETRGTTRGTTLEPADTAEVPPAAEPPAPKTLFHPQLTTVHRLARPFELCTVPSQAPDDMPEAQRPPGGAPRTVDYVVLDVLPDASTPADADTHAVAVDMLEEATVGQQAAKGMRSGDATEPGTGVYVAPPSLVWRGNLRRFTRLLARTLRPVLPLTAAPPAASDTGAQTAPVAKPAAYPTHCGDPVDHRLVRLVPDPSLFDDGLDIVRAALGEQDPEVLERRKPLRGDPYELAMLDSGAEPAKLDVHLSSVQFEDHPLFCKEDVMAAGLQALYKEYCRLRRAALVTNRVSRLDALLGGAPVGGATVYDFERDDDRQLEARALEVLSTISQQFVDAEYSTNLAMDIYNKWQALRDLRLQPPNPTTSTPVKVVLDRVERRGPYEGPVKPRHVDLARQLIARLRDLGSDAARGLVDKGTRMLDKISQQERDGYRPGLWHNGQEVAIRVTHDAHLTADDMCSRAERSRRAAVARTQVKAKLIVNGQEVASSPAVPLQFPSFSAPVSLSVSLSMRRRPTSMEVQVWQTGWLWGTKLASMALPIPGMTTGERVVWAASQPLNSWFQFSSTAPMPRRDVQFYEPAAAAAPGTTVPSRDRFTTGAAKVYAGWASGVVPENPPKLSEGPVLRVTPGGRKVTVRSGDGTNVGSLSGRTASQLVHKLGGTFDPNDPRNAELMRLLRAEDASTDRGSRFRTQPLLSDLRYVQDPEGRPMRKLLQGRHRLLRLRSAHPEMFKEVVPLEDDAIRRSAHLSGILREHSRRRRGLEEEDEDDGSSFLDVAAVATAKAKAMQGKIRNFVARVQASAVGKARFERGPQYYAVVVEDPPPVKGLFDIEGYMRLLRPETSFFGGPKKAIKELLAPRRRLMPRRTPGLSSVMTLMAGSVEQERVEITVQVVRARNVPLRRTATEAVPATSQGGSVYTSQHITSGTPAVPPLPMAGTPAAGGGGVDPEASSFVEVRFQGASTKTTANAGQAPQWNELLTLPFRPPNNDFTPLGLAGITDRITLSLFDEVAVEGVDDDRDKLTTRTRRQRRFLGTVSIPFTTLYFTGRIEGELPLQSPLANLGYRAATSSHGGISPRAPTGTAVFPPTCVDTRTQTYVYVSAALRPSLPQPTFDDASSRKWDSAMPRGLMERVDKWTSTYKSKCPNLKAYATDLKGNSVLLCRYLTPMAPPPDLSSLGADGMDTPHVGPGSPPRASPGRYSTRFDATTTSTAAEIAPQPIPDDVMARMGSTTEVSRFVSLIPFLDDWHAFPRHMDLWTTCAEMLDMGAGDWEEHAVLLCNYFLWLERSEGAPMTVTGAPPPRGWSEKSWQSFLVLGRAIPDGEAVWVGRRHLTDDQVLLVNPVTGTVYAAAKDDHCPLQQVDAVVFPNNMYASKQKVREPFGLDFSWDFEDPKRWAPLFTSLHPYPDVASVQPPVTYTRPSAAFVRDLEGEIYQNVKTGLRHWRARYATRVRNDLSGSLRPLLERLEQQRLGVVPVAGGQDFGLEHLRGPQFERLVSSYQVNGFPVNVAFKDLEHVVSAVKNTGIHDVESPDVQFIISVLVVPYPCDVFSVWVYMVSLTPNRSR